MKSYEGKGGLTNLLAACHCWFMNEYENNFIPVTRQALPHQTETVRVTLDISIMPNDLDMEEMAKFFEEVFMKRNPLGNWSEEFTVTGISKTASA